MKMLALCLALSGPGQDVPREGEFIPLNRVQVIINEECVTLGDVQSKVGRMGRDVTTQEELATLFQRVVFEEIRFRLKAQAGKDLGFDRDMVDRFVKDQIEGRKERAKSAARMAEFLSGTDSAAYYASTEEYVLAELWTRSVRGQFPGPGGRPYVDRWVRPGILKYESEQRTGRLQLSEQLLLQQLVADPRRTGSSVSARELAVDLREEILAGGDFGRIAEDNECAELGTGGVAKPVPRQRLMLIPELSDFLATAEIGDVSEVLPYRDENGIVRGWRVIKLLDVQRIEAPSFLDLEYQEFLTEERRKGLDQYREDLALTGLLEAAYVWPPEAFGRAETPEQESPSGPLPPPPPPRP